MYSLTPPARNHLADYDAFVGGRRSAEVRARLVAARGAFEAAYRTYELEGANPSRIRPATATASLQSAWRDNYNQLSSSGRMSSMRDDLRVRTRNDRCPLCGIGSARTLDHYLPKSRYPEFSSLALNLVPACDKCNQLKGRKVGSSPSKQVLHPYYDALPDEQVLTAVVSIHETVVVDYRIERTPSLSADTFERAKYHFRRFKLGDMFSKSSNQELQDYKLFYPGMHRRGGIRMVQHYLTEVADSTRHSRGHNDWKTALYVALAGHDEFCDGGFEAIDAGN